MFTHMQFIRKDMHQARGKQNELLTYKAMETEEYRIYISADGFGIGDVFCVSHDVLEVYKASPLKVAHLLFPTRDEFSR